MTRTATINMNEENSIKYILCDLLSDTGKTKADVNKDRFMVNQENERPDQERRSVKHDIVPTWGEVHKGQLISKAIFHDFPCSKKPFKFQVQECFHFLYAEMKTIQLRKL